MPLYEYQCTTCGKLTEKRQKFSDPEITECPHCGGRLERTITAPAVQFKGGGWYADLYSSGKKAAPNTGTESSSGDTTKSDGAGKAESAAPSAAPASAPAPSSTPASPSSSSSSGS